MRYLVGFWNLEDLSAPEGYVAHEEWLKKKLGKDLVGWADGLLLRPHTVMRRTDRGTSPR